MEGAERIRTAVRALGASYTYGGLGGSGVHTSNRACESEGALQQGIRTHRGGHNTKEDK